MPDSAPSFHFRVPARDDTLGGWIARLLPDVERRVRRGWIADGQVRVGSRVQDRGDRPVPRGANVTIAVPSSASLDAPRLRADARGTHAAWVAWIVDPPWWAGTLPIGAKGGEGAPFAIDARSDGYARAVVTSGGADAVEVLDAFASLGLPVVGDIERGGLGVAGGPFLAPAATSLASPDERVFRVDHESPPARAEPRDARRDPEDLHVSDETARVLARGHPWILPDAASESTAGFRPGALVRVLDHRDRPLAWARIEGEARIAARVWARGGESADALESVESRIARALARRRSHLAADPGEVGNTVRLIHGEADGLPGLFVDRLGALLRVLTTGASAFGHRDRALAALRNQLPVSPEGHAWTVIELLHLRDPAGRAVDRVRFVDGDLERLRATHADVDAKGFVVRERGLDYFVDPGWDAPRRPRPGYGLFLDQRANRDRVAERAARGGRWLNLFAHTGAFSVALLAAGADRVTEVDLSAAYLQRLEANLERNRARGVDPARHETVRGDVRRALEGLPASARFDGIVLDPPTAAAAGRRFWSLREDLEPLLSAALSRLEPGGHLLVTQNRAGPPLGLDRVVDRLARRSHRPVEAIEPAPAGDDHPSMPGFPEGDPFEGVLLDLR